MCPEHHVFVSEGPGALEHADHVLHRHLFAKHADLRVRFPVLEFRGDGLQVLVVRGFEVGKFLAEGAFEQLARRGPLQVQYGQPGGDDLVLLAFKRDEGIVLGGGRRVADENDAGGLAFDGGVELQPERTVRRVDARRHRCIEAVVLPVARPRRAAKHDHPLPLHVEPCVVVVLEVGSSDAVPGESDAGGSLAAARVAGRFEVGAGFHGEGLAVGAGEGEAAGAIEVREVVEREGLEETAVLAGGLETGRLERRDDVIRGLVQTRSADTAPLALRPGEEEQILSHPLDRGLIGHRWLSECRNSDEKHDEKRMTNECEHAERPWGRRCVHYAGAGKGGTGALRFPVCGERVLRFPQRHLDDRQIVAHRVLEDHLGDVLGGRVHVQFHERFALPPQFRDHRIVAVQKHAVVECLVDPGAEDALDGCEIHDHAERVEDRRFERDDGPGVVPVQVSALPVVLEQAVAVTEVDFFRDSEHRYLA